MVPLAKTNASAIAAAPDCFLPVCVTGSSSGPDYTTFQIVMRPKALGTAKPRRPGQRPGLARLLVCHLVSHRRRCRNYGRSSYPTRHSFAKTLVNRRHQLDSWEPQ